MTHSLSLLAQMEKSSKLEEIAEGFQHGRTRSMELPGFQWFIGAFGVLLVLLLVMGWWSQRNARRAARFSPVRLFAQALRKMDLSLSDRILLRLVARSSELDQPVVLLFSPALLGQQLAAWSARLSPSLLRRYARGRLNTVIEKVFVEE